MSAADLHGRLVAEVSRRLDIARATTPGPWTADQYVVGRSGKHWPWTLDAGTLENARYIALHGPDDAIRRYEADLERLKAHSPFYPVDTDGWGNICDTCRYFTGEWPCDELLRVAASLGIDPDGEAAG